MARLPSPTNRGLTLMEVLIALILLAIISTLFLRTSTSSIRDTGKSMDWQLETVVIEKTVENLRRRTSASQLRALDSTGTDKTGDIPITVRVKGAAPPAGTCTDFPCDSVAQITVTARRATFPDSISITTFLFPVRP